MLRVVRDPAQSEEVAQEAYLEIWRSSARFDADQGQRDELDDDHRPPQGRRPGPLGRGRQPAGPAYEAASQDRPYDITAEQVERSLDAQRVRSALESLTETQRGAVQLAYFGGYTHTEVAALLGIPLGTAKTRIRDGLIRLRDTLGMQP